MSKLTDYLTKQIFIEKNVVTYRLLSRVFSLHVNDAKNELAAFLSSSHPSAEQTYATYIISGETPPQSKGSRHKVKTVSEVDDMDVELQEPADSVNEAEEAGCDDVPRTTMVLVGQADLENARAQFNRIYAEHVYCLSPAPVQDAGLICTPLSDIYDADTKVAADASMLLGRIVGSHVQMGKIIPAKTASSLKTKTEVPPRASMKKEKEIVMEATQKKVENDESVPSKGKPSGKLDWSRAKPKGTNEGKKETKPAPKEKSWVKTAAMDVDLVKDTESKLSMTKGKDVGETPPNVSSNASAHNDQVKRGTKRKSTLRLDSHSDNEAKASVRPAIESTRGTKRKSSVETDSASEDVPSLQNTLAGLGKGRKKVIVSDDEEDEAHQRKVHSMGKQPVEKSQTKQHQDIPQSLRAMFDIDDAKVIQGSSRSTLNAPTHANDNEQVPQSESKEDDMEMDADSDVPVKAPPKKKKKEKKIIPVGNNGLKKKRIVKQKMFMDDSGYMVTEDYSSYESVDEEDIDAPKARKGMKAKQTAAETVEDTKLTKASMKEPRKPNARPSGSAASGKSASGGSKPKAKGSIQNFFSKT